MRSILLFGVGTKAAAVVDDVNKVEKNESTKIHHKRTKHYRCGMHIHSIQWAIRVHIGRGREASTWNG
jgi:hypothetical protein